MRAWVLGLLLVGCPRREVAIAATDGEARESSPVESALPRVRVLNDIATFHRKRVIVEGTYEIDPLAGHGKGQHLTWIVLADGTRISRAYGAVEDEYGFAGLRVEATGTITSGPPDSKKQALMAPHLEVESLVLPGGGKVAKASEIPAPPVFSAAPSLAPRIDRWVQVVGTLTTVRTDATITLADGGVVRVEEADASFAPLVGKLVTVTGRLALEKGSGTFGLELVMRGRTAICAGAVPRCGM